jgi:hypothetical protein
MEKEIEIDSSSYDEESYDISDFLSEVYDMLNEIR